MKKFLTAALMLASTSVFATTTTFSGYDQPGTNNSKTTKISISYTDSSFDLSGVLDPSFRLINENNSGLYNGLTLISDADDTFTYSPIILPLHDFDLTRYTFSFSNLAAGTYTLQFNLIAGGNYTGSYTISPVTVPVPEPETYGMMLVGLGLMGTIALRRQKNR
ncbi:MAG TPA: FxDxF family PEP-CTERM protein [Methylophilus sp.]|uniref:FxDxF family PEP-CTERM protein n=1 Tax=Methylophilus sp. TaxID=29541 RepID=UPI002CA82439|nr:FxDxF family PEP-CTERM protein [Methylophilus sp.]HSH88154.1 FxDxF family PEP-CTERM protein [Methylophilus sp.]